MNAHLVSPELTAAVLPEDRARADFYALIARLFYAGPDAGLLAAIAGADQIAAETENVSLAQAWQSLIAAAAAIDAQAAQEEYDRVFVGTGKAEVTPYASHYLAPAIKGNVLVQLRAELAAMGLARDRSATESEDHFSGLCEVMRHLIHLGSDDAAVQKEKTFFSYYIGISYVSFCNSLTASPNTDFYKHVARFTQAFLEVESESFDVAQ